MNISWRLTRARHHRRPARMMGLGQAVLKLLGAKALAPVTRPASTDERWQQAFTLINDVALQTNRLALLALVELERSEAGTPGHAQLAEQSEQLRLLARHSADAARAFRAAGPPR